MFMSYLIPQDSFATSCQTDGSTCEFYSCYEEEREDNSCGNRGYVLGFGKKYCDKFLNDQKFTQIGKQWLLDVRECLQEELALVDAGSSCQEIKKAGISSHAPCYIDLGFCQLPRSDQRRILATVFWAGLDPMVAKSGRKILSDCRDLGYPVRILYP